MKPADIKRIAEAARPHGMAILERWLPGGKKVGANYVVLNPHRADEHAGSLSVNADTGLGADFADGPRFKDFVAVVAFAQQCTMSKAAEAVAGFLGIPLKGDVQTSAPPPAPKKKPATTWTIVIPISKDHPKVPGHERKRVTHSVLGPVDHVYFYRDETGNALGYVCRWDATPKRKKEFRPLTLWQSVDGKQEWRWQAWPEPRPLYGLDLLAARPDAVVAVHEGEKATEAGRILLPDCVSTCWPNGAASNDKADSRPLAGRDVLLWADYDDPGTNAMQTAAKAAKKAGAKSVKFVNVDLFAKHTVNAAGRIVDRLADLPAGWDAADALAEGWTPQALAELLAREDALLDSLVAETPSAEEVVKPTTTSKNAQRFGPYLNDPDRGLFYVEHKDDEDVETPICGPLVVPALGSNGDGDDYAPVLEFSDRDGRPRQEIIPYSMFLGQGFDGIKLLADRGLEIAANAKALERLRHYIVGAKPHRRARFFSQTGWHERVFRLPDCTIGETDDTHIFRGNRRAQSVYATKGKLIDWQTQIAHAAIGNPRLMFCLSTAFAGPLLKPLNLQGAAFHLCGDSSIGKSGGQHAAGSVWGPPDAQVHSWRTTDNAVEYTAAQHNHALLILDELREVDPKAASAIVYMLTNARGKGRAHHGGGLREATTWCIVMLSSGELGLSDHLASANQKLFAGQEVRFIEIDGDAGAGHGMWNNVGACIGGGKQFTDSIKKFATRYYGTAGRAFLTELVKDKNLNQLPAWWRSHESAFAEQYKPKDAGGQVLRVMSAFCLVGFAGELAARFEVVPWQRGEALSAAGRLFTDWQQARPTAGNSEEGMILAHVRGVMERSWQSRFVDWERTQEKESDLSRMTQIIDPLGFRKRDEPFVKDNPDYLFYVTRSRFAEVFATKEGFKPKRVAAVLKKHGLLRCDDDSTTLKQTLPNGDPRSYCIIGKKLWSPDE
jgi:putative DNA primase/helicase